MDSVEISTETSIPAKLRGETMAYAMQNCVFNLAANFFEPYLGSRIQKYYSHGASGYGSYSQNLGGEFMGDISGAGTLMLAEALAPKQLHTFTRAARKLVDPIYTSAAHIVFADQCNEPDYQQTIERWKTIHERNLVRSAIMAGAGIAGNIASQKYIMGNPSPASHIFKGKLLSTALTTSLGLAVRFAFTDKTRDMEQWMSRNLFAPWMKDKNTLDETAVSHVERLAKENPAKGLSPTV